MGWKVLAHVRQQAVAYLALFVALGGTTYAAVKIPKNSVGTKQLKQGAVTLAKISKGTRTTLKGRTGPRGLTGPHGSTGPQGPGATRFWTDTNVGIGPKTVFQTSDFKLDTRCVGGDEPDLRITRLGGANVAVNGFVLIGQPNTAQGTPYHLSDFLTTGSDTADPAVVPTGEMYSAVLTVQSYAPGTDTAHNYTIQFSASDPGFCTLWGSVIPAS